MLHFGEKFVREDGDVRAVDARSSQDVHNLGRNHRAADDLLDGQLALLPGRSRACAAFDQRGADRLKKADFFPDLAGLIRGRRQGKSLGQGQHGVRVAAVSVLFALLRLFCGCQLLLQVKNPLDGSCHHRQALLRRAAQCGCVVKAVVHVSHDLVLLHHDGDGLLFVDTGVFLVVLGILLQRRLQVLRNADVVHDQPGRFVTKHTVHASNCLHQAVAAHGLVHVHRVHARRIKAGQPHIPHDHQLERV